MNVEKAKEIHSSQLWEEVCGEIDNRIQAEMQKLTVCTADKLVDIQRRIQFYGEIKRLPQDVIDREE